MEKIDGINREIMEKFQQMHKKHLAKSTGTQSASAAGATDENREYYERQAARGRIEQLEKCGIYKRYADSTFAAIESAGVPAHIRENYETVRDYADNLNDNLRAGTGLIMCGPVGTLKTSLAVAILHAALAAETSGFVVTMPSLLDTIFTLKQKNMDEWLRFETKIRETPLLVLDDLGGEYSSNWVLNKVDAIISDRYNRCRSTIVTTNLTGEQLRTTYAERVIDRLRATNKIITFSGKSLRDSA